MIKTKKQKITALLFFLPAFLLLAVFYIAPAAVSIFYSFTNKALAGLNADNWTWIGIQNYSDLLRDERFWKSFINTIIFLFGSAIIGQQVLGFTIAYLMRNKSRKFRRVIGSCVLLCWVTPEVVVSFVFFAYLNSNGSLNEILGFLGLGPVPWLFNFAMISIIGANIWRGTAFSMMMFQSGLDNVPNEILEAASIDGANKTQKLFRIIIPSMKGSIVTNTVLITLSTLGLFGLIYALTGGGPGMDTTTIPIYMYNKAFKSYQIGYGTAIATILLIFGISLSIFYVRASKHDL